MSDSMHQSNQATATATEPASSSVLPPASSTVPSSVASTAPSNAPSPASSPVPSPASSSAPLPASSPVPSNAPQPTPSSVPSTVPSTVTTTVANPALKTEARVIVLEHSIKDIIARMCIICWCAVLLCIIIFHPLITLAIVTTMSVIFGCFYYNLQSKTAHQPVPKPVLKTEERVIVLGHSIKDIITLMCIICWCAVLLCIIIFHPLITLAIVTTLSVIFGSFYYNHLQDVKRRKVERCV